ncbi:MAG: LysM peptidoglycan-binding domain-containing protein [Candidatus Ozemobacteraceae bacterium]
MIQNRRRFQSTGGCSSLTKVLLIFAILASAMPVFAGKTYTMKGGDTLWDLAQKFYGDPTLYPVFLEVNSISNPRTIPNGRVINIPNFDEIKKIAAEPDPVKRRALIGSVTGKQISSPSGSSTGTTPTQSSSSSGSNSGQKKPVTGGSRSFDNVLSGPTSPDAIKMQNTSDTAH